MRSLTLPVIVHSGRRNDALHLASSLSRHFSTDVIVLENDEEFSTDLPPDSGLVVIAFSAGSEWTAAIEHPHLACAPKIGIIADHLSLHDHLHEYVEIFDDLLVEPFREEELIWRIKRANGTGALHEKERLSRNIMQKLGMENIIGKDPAFLDVVAKIPMIAECDVPVLLTGETGVGKEVCTRAIHYLSKRASGPFIPVDCGSLPTNLIENELFGHQKGAYTDARSNALGLVKEAEGGTLFLDEIDMLSREAQAKLLRLLQEKTYRPLGYSKQIQANVRIIGATNVDMRRKVNAGEFRRDLFYRFSLLLRLPTLKERKSDIPELAEFFLTKYRSQFGNVRRSLSPAAAAKLLSYDWPGNIRELENMIQHALLLTRSSVIRPEHIPLDQGPEAERHETLPFAAAKKRALGEFEKQYVTQALLQAKGNISLAAKISQKDRADFSRLVKRYYLNRG
jgi:DNA-binding NtrC family response regulator